MLNKCTQGKRRGAVLVVSAYGTATPMTLEGTEPSSVRQAEALRAPGRLGSMPVFGASVNQGKVGHTFRPWSPPSYTSNKPPTLVGSAEHEYCVIERLTKKNTNPLPFATLPFGLEGVIAPMVWLQHPLVTSVFSI